MEDDKPIQKGLEYYLELEKNGDVGMISPSGFGIPVLYAAGDCMARTWENSMLALYYRGSGAPTEYDKIGDPESRDCTMALVIENPLAQPIVHRCFPGGVESLEEYRQEVIDGIRNFQCRELTDPTATTWEYTYNERLFAYSVPLSKIAENLASMSDKAKRKLQENKVRILLEQPWARVENRIVKKYDITYNSKGEIIPVVIGEDKEKVVVINQIHAAIDGLIKVPHTRRLQAVTWKPWEDLVAYDPACMQSFWFRILNKTLSTNVRFRSRDSYKAAFMNMYANRDIHLHVAREVSRGRGEEIIPGRILDLSDSYHTYGKDLKEFEELFLGQLKKRTFQERTFTKEVVDELVAESRQLIGEKIKIERENKGLD
jgi:thymidylate synthase